MSLNTSQVKKLLETKKPLQFKQLAFSLMYTRLKVMYQKSPTDATVTSCTTQINELFKKFGSTITDDYNVALSV
jgi:hypothetical protein